MRRVYFSQGKRGGNYHYYGKTRITIYLDDEILDSFRAKAEAQGLGYQTLINEALKMHLRSHSTPLTENDLRRILREELVQGNTLLNL